MASATALRALMRRRRLAPFPESLLRLAEHVAAQPQPIIDALNTFGQLGRHIASTGPVGHHDGQRRPGSQPPGGLRPGHSTPWDGGPGPWDAAPDWVAPGRPDVCREPWRPAKQRSGWVWSPLPTDDRACGFDWCRGHDATVTVVDRHGRRTGRPWEIAVYVPGAVEWAVRDLLRLPADADLGLDRRDRRPLRRRDLRAELPRELYHEGLVFAAELIWRTDGLEHALETGAPIINREQYLKGAVRGYLARCVWGRNDRGRLAAYGPLAAGGSAALAAMHDAAVGRDRGALTRRRPASNRPNVRHTQPADETDQPGAGGDTDRQGGEVRRRVESVYAALRPSHVEVLRLVADGLCWSEIGRRLGISKQGAQQRFERAAAAFRAVWMDRYGAAPEQTGQNYRRSEKNLRPSTPYHHKKDTKTLTPGH